MEDIFVIWPQGPDRLRDFVVHQDIQFIMNESATSTSWMHIFTGDLMALLPIKCTVNLPIPTSTYTLALITTHPTHML
jgi:hypothetical protein